MKDLQQSWERLAIFGNYTKHPVFQQLDICETARSHWPNTIYYGLFDLWLATATVTGT